MQILDAKFKINYMKALSILLFTMFAVITAAGQSTSTILKRAERALGGKAVIVKLTTRIQKGTIRRVSDGAAGQYSLATAQPNLYHVRWDLGGFEFEAGYNGRSGWVRDSREGLRTLTGEASLRFQTEAVFRNSLWFNYKKAKSRLLNAGKAEVRGRPANVLILTNIKAVSIKIFFDAESGLPVREEFPAADGLSAIEYTDFREVGAVKQPFAIRMESGGEAYEIVLDSVELSKPVARSNFDFPEFSGQPLPDVRSFLEEVRGNEDRVEEILDTYSYIQKITRRKLGKDGVLRDTESETFQMSFYKGYRITRLIEKNGQPLSPSEQADADREAQKDAEEIEKKIAKAESGKGKSGPPGEEGRRVSIAEVLRASRLINPRRERFREREVIVFDFEPDPEFDFKNAKSMLKFFGKTAGVVWVDEKDKQVARVEAVLADNYNVGAGLLAKLKKGATFTLEQERVNDEIWLPSSADINLSVRVLLVKGIDVNQVIRSYDYRKFVTEVKDAKIDEGKQP